MSLSSISPLFSETDIVLLVEDEPFIALDMEETLIAAGYHVEAKASRLNAVNWLACNTPSVAILDLHLKDGDGTEIASILQSRGVPVVFCSGGNPSDLPEDFQGALWVHKPFINGELVGAVCQALDSRDFRQQVEARA